MIDIPRDRYDRPLIIPTEGGKPVPYARVSKIAKAIDDTTQLTLWKQRKTAEGMVRRQDLITRTAGAIAVGDPDTDRATKKKLNDICEQAIEAAGASRGSSAGTGLHELTEAIDSGNEPLFIPEDAKPRLEAYRKATAGYTSIGIETFVVNDTVQAAGTFDRLWLCPDGRVRVADLKTGKSEADYPLATTTQIAIYANALRYDPATGARAELHPDIDLSTGVLIHMPPSGGCTLYELNLEAGWEAAQVAAQVLRIRKWKPAELSRVVA